MITDFLVARGERAKRLDLFLVTHERHISRAKLQRLIAAGRVLVNGRTTRASHLVRGGDRVSIQRPVAQPLERDDKPEDLSVLYEDSELLVIDKPSGVVMHPGSGHWVDTLLNATLHYCVVSGQPHVQPRLVHRLDRETSGVIVMAKTKRAQTGLGNQFARHTISRVYVALISKVPKQVCVVIDESIGRDRRRAARVSNDTLRPRPAVTTCQVLESYGNLVALVDLRPQTGRTHQLRAHLSLSGHPILGDVEYGGLVHLPFTNTVIPRVMLHARSLGFRHPVTGAPMELNSPIPPDMFGLYQLLEAGFVPTEGLQPTV